MANQPTTGLDSMMKMFDPEQMKNMFDPEQMKKMFQPPAAMNIDFNSIMQNNQQNYEAMMAANKSATAAYNDFYQKQMAIFQDMMEQARKLAESDQVTAQADAAKEQSKIYQAAARKALDNMTALAEETRKANEEAFKVVEKQVKDAVEELKRL